MPVASLDPTNPRTLTSPTPNPVTPTLTPPHPHPTPHHHSHPLGCKVQRSLIPDHSFMTRPPGAGGLLQQMPRGEGSEGKLPLGFGGGSRQSPLQGIFAWHVPAPLAEDHLPAAGLHCHSWDLTTPSVSLCLGRLSATPYLGAQESGQQAPAFPSGSGQVPDGAPFPGPHRCT